MVRWVSWGSWIGTLIKFRIRAKLNMKNLQCSKIYLGLGGYTLPPTSINVKHRLEFSLPINAHSGKLIAMENGPGMKMYIENGDIPLLLLMEEIPNNHLGCIKPCKSLDKLPTSTG